jgi:hypothetical protein
MASVMFVLSAFGASNAHAVDASYHCTSRGVACSYIWTDVVNGVPKIQNARQRFKLSISAWTVDNGRRSPVLTQDKIGDTRWRAFIGIRGGIFYVGSSADAVCFDVKDDGKGAFCHWNVRD